MEGFRNISGNVNSQPVFMKGDEMPVTSSPIEGKLIGNPPFYNQIVGNVPTWADLLGDFQNGKPQEKWNPQASIASEEPTTSFKDSNNSSDFEPIARHKMRVVVTPNRKIHVVASSRQKLDNIQTMKSYSKLSKAYRHNFRESVDPGEDIETIKEKLKTKENLNLEVVERYEQALRKLIENQTKLKNKDEMDEILNSDVMNFIEKSVGKMYLTPSTTRVLKVKQQQQERRLVSLAIAKRKSAADIKRRLNAQQTLAHHQIAERENQELKQIKASALRKDAITKSNLFNKAHSAHCKKLVDQQRQKKYTQELGRQLQREKVENNNQAQKIVHDIWNDLLKQQYGEMRKEIGLRNKVQREIVHQSIDQLQKFKDGYEEKLKELKKAAEAKAAESGIVKKDVQSEIQRIKRNLHKQFDVEFQSLLQKVQSKSEHMRFLRDERARTLKERIQKAEFVFDL